VGASAPTFEKDYIMLKKDKNYRLPKSVKRMMAGKVCTNPNQLKDTMIQGQILGSIMVKSSKKQKSDSKTVAVEE